MPHEPTELEAIAERIRRRGAEERADRARQRELMRARKAEGRTIDSIQLEARVSRPTVIAALKRAD